MTPKRSLFEDRGTDLHIAPLLDGVKALSGEKIQWYLASELRDRMRDSGVRVTVVDRVARKQYTVEPRKYEGRLLHQLPPLRTPLGDVYAELYLNPAADTNRIGLFRRGTRVLEDLAQLEDFARPPWTTGCLQGHLDAPFVNLTPGTRSGLIRDDAYGAHRSGNSSSSPAPCSASRSRRRRAWSRWVHAASSVRCRAIAHAAASRSRSSSSGRCSKAAAHSSARRIRS